MVGFRIWNSLEGRVQPGQERVGENQLPHFMGGV